MYSEFMDDPKVQMMSESDQRRLVMLFCERCKEVKHSETLRAFHWRITPLELGATKAVFIEHGFIDEHWNILKWDERQFISDSSTERVRQYRQRLKKFEAPEGKGFVYFAQLHNRVKIGYSENPWSRIRALKLETPGIEMVAMHYGTPQDERKTHMCFGSDWIDGEWFNFSEGIRNHIKSIVETQRNVTLNDVTAQESDTESDTEYLNSYPLMPDGISDVDRKEEARLAKEAAKEAEKQAKAEAREVARAAKALADAAAKAAVKKYREEQRRSKKASSPPTKTEFAQSRHADFKVAIFEYWKSKNPEIDCPWQQAEGMQLELWLRASPTTTLFQFKNMLRNRYRSDVTHSERPSVWIKNITNYAGGPLDRFGKPVATGGKTNGRSADRALETANNLIQEIEDNHGAHTVQLLQGGGAY
jgi:hypothetical protein